MSYYDEDDYSGPRYAPRTGPRMLYERKDESASNIQAWKDGIASAKSNDAQAMFKALINATGEAYAFNTKGKPARNPLSRAILALQADPNAWRRLREDCQRHAFGPTPVEGDGASTEPWAPSSVCMVEYLWAANPQCLAEAVALHRAKCLEDQRWWSSPVVRRPWSSPPELASLFRSAASRHYDPQLMRRGLLCEPGMLDPDAPTRDPAERAALGEILSEAARACLEGLWPHEESSAAKREKNETVWDRGGSDLGVSWPGAGVALGAGSATPLLNAVHAMMDEGLASGREAADLACRKATLCLDGARASPEARSAALSRWIRAHPEAQEGLPLLPHDWMLPKELFSLCSAAGVGDAALGRWIAGAGKHWQAPAHFNHSGCLTQGFPSWSHQSRTNDSKTAPAGIDQWSVLEWALFSRPEAAREACLRGAKLAESTESVLLSQAGSMGSGRGNPFDFPKAHAWAEACRIAEASAQEGAGLAKRKSMSI